MHLRAEMPAARIVSRGHMELRIARKVAALYGIPGDPQSSDDAGRGRAWLSDFAAITATELALGGPLRPDPKADDGGVFTRRGGGRPVHVDGAVDPAMLPNATLANYGPDTRAALTLAGVNKILEPVTEAVQEALQDVLRQVDSPVLLVAVGQCLLQEVFVAQPFLVLGALQAGQVQRALSLPGHMVRRIPGDHPLARVEYGYEQKEPSHRPLHLDVVRELWRSVAHEGETFDDGGTVDDGASGLRAKPLFDFEQAAETVGATGSADGRERLLALLTSASEESLLGTSPGSPHSEIRVFDGGVGDPQVEVVVPRQRQIELMLSLLAPRLSRRLHHKPVAAGGALRLPRIDVDQWRERPLLNRRAALLAHYYSLRAAGWIAGMPRFDHRRNRDHCAERCLALVEATHALLEPSDPLRHTIRAWALSYHLQHAVTWGQPVRSYHELGVAVDHLPRAELLEILPLVLHNALTVRRAVALGLVTEISQADLAHDLKRWWGVVRKLREELIERSEEIRYMDNVYAQFLLDRGSSDEELREGLVVAKEVIDSRLDVAHRDGRWIGVRQALMTYICGLTLALERGLDSHRRAEYLFELCTYAHKLEVHGETKRYIKQRVSPHEHGEPSYDESALLLLLNLVRAWLAALDLGLPAEVSRDEVTVRLDEWAKTLRDYLAALRRSTPYVSDDAATSRLDPMRERIADELLQRWRANVAARATAGQPGDQPAPRR